MTMQSGGTKGVRVAKPKPGALSPERAAQIATLIKSAKIETVPVGAVHPNPRNAKRHPRKQLTILMESIRQFGFTGALIVDDDGEILAGHARHEAALQLGLSEIPIMRLMHLSPEEKRAFSLADNKIGELGTWDLDQLRSELMALTDPSLDLCFDVEITGIDTVEIDALLNPSPSRTGGADPADILPSVGSDAAPVTAPGYLWNCGSHLLACNDPLEHASYDQLLAGAPADLVFVDPPVRALEERGPRLKKTAARLAAYVRSGGVVYWFVAPPRLEELFQQVDPLLGRRRELLVWVKGSLERGDLYQSEYGHVAVYVIGPRGPLHQAQFAHRKRHRSDVWPYPATKHGGETDKPVALIADALQDCSVRRAIVLDPYAGSGATMIAAERTGRRARLIEPDPAKCDLIVRRWQEFTGGTARLAGGSETFAELAEQRSAKTR